MVSPSRLKASSAIKKMASPPSVDSSLEQPAASTSSVSTYRVGTAAMILPNLNATVEASRDDATSSTPSAPVSPEHILSSNGNNHSDSASSSVPAINSNGVALPPKARAPKKTPGKRPRPDSNVSSASSSGAAAVPAKKRGRSNALMRSAPLATAAVTPGSLAGNSEFMNFTATIFIIQLGPDGPQFHAHESVLKRSPKLTEEIDKAKANKRATKQNTLPLMTHDAVAFEQMLQFLYKDKFLMSKNKHTALARLGEFKELMSLAKHYILPDLQKQVVKLYSSSKILSKVPALTFFDWAEDMYHEELDHENGPFKVYLSKVAPMLLKSADPTSMKELVRMVHQGGGFAGQLFIAATTAMHMQTDLLSIKKEEGKEKSTPACSRTGKDKEPVRQNVSQGVCEEGSDAPEDDSMQDNEHLFVEN